MSYPPYPPAGGTGYPNNQPGYPSSGNVGFPSSQPSYPPGPGYPSGPNQMPNPGGTQPGTVGFQTGPTSYPPPPGPHQPAPYPSVGFSGGPPPPGPYAGYPSGPPQPQYQNYGPPPQPQPQPQPPLQPVSQYPPQPYPTANTKPPSRPAPPQPHTMSHATQQMGAMHLGSQPQAAAYKPPKTEGTVKPHRPFNAESDSKVLRTAMKGFGTDEKAIISVVAHRSNAQRQEIKVRFKALYGKDLIKELKSELSGHFEEVVLGLLMTPAEYDSFQLRRAMKGLGTDEACLIEILCSRTSEEVEAIKKQFKTDHKQNLEKAIISETSGHFKRLLVSMLTAGREKEGPVNMEKAKKDAQDLYQAGEAKWGTDESKFNQILASRSYSHLAVVFKEYSKVCKYDIEQSIKREMSGDLEDGMLAIVKCVKNKSAYFAERLYKSMKGLGTDDDTLIRVMVSRCEVDMMEIKREFMAKYHKSLGSFIKGDTSGDYRRILMALAGED